MPKHNKWNDQDDQQLKELWGKKTADDIADVMGRHRLTILKKAKELGLREPRSKKWSQEERDFLIDNYQFKTSEEIGKLLGRSAYSVRKQIELMRLKKEWTYKRVDKDGYVEIVLGSSVKAREHRLVYEEMIGRKLGPKEIIHHLDEDKQNNRWENLILVSPSTHNQLHAYLKRRDKNKLLTIVEKLSLDDAEKFKKWLSTLSFT